MGLLLCRAGFAWQLMRDWHRHGLTYVSWATLLALSLGSGALGLWGIAHADPRVVAAAMIPGGADLVVSGLKTRDWLCTRFRIPVGGHHRSRRR